MNREFDWNLIKAFLAVADHGSLSAAANALAISQPTLGRHITQLEHACALTLFDRGRSGMKLTEAGLDLLSDARDMKADADRFSLAVTGRQDAIEGTVRISASQIVATFVLPEIIAKLRHAEPGIELEIVASNKIENLLARDADIAIRMVRPEQNDLIIRKAADFGMGAYAALSYLHAHPEPRSQTELKNHNIIGYDRETLIIDGMRRFGLEVSRADFALRLDDQVAYWFMVKAGCGIGFAPRLVGDAETAVKRILPDIKIPTLPMWLASHTELRTSRRIRRVSDFLYEALATMQLDPP